MWLLLALLGYVGLKESFVSVLAVGFMPAERTEQFLARVGVGNRIQVPVLVRWRNRLQPDEILSVHVFCEGLSD